jgi:hypothetical protein
VDAKKKKKKKWQAFAAATAATGREDKAWQDGEVGGRRDKEMHASATTPSSRRLRQKRASERSRKQTSAKCLSLPVFYSGGLIRIRF